MVYGGAEETVGSLESELMKMNQAHSRRFQKCVRWTLRNPENGCHTSYEKMLRPLAFGVRAEVFSRP